MSIKRANLAGSRSLQIRLSSLDSDRTKNRASSQANHRHYNNRYYCTLSPTQTNPSTMRRKATFALFAAVFEDAAANCEQWHEIAANKI